MILEAITSSVLLGRAKQILTGPAGAAIIVSIAGLGLVLGTVVTVHSMTGRAATAARAACVSEAEADRLKRVNAALKDAHEQQQSTLKRRGEALEQIELRVKTVEKERDDAREAAKPSPSCSVVFDVDDPWLRPKQPAAKLRPGVR